MSLRIHVEDWNSIQHADFHILMLVKQMASVPFSCGPYQMLSDCRALQYEVRLNHCTKWHWLEKMGGGRFLLKVII